jgi:RsiW-degrading membrane proteinase PrsW (M82 family)
VFSVATPLIEETVKIALIVFYLRRINHPLEGFVLGILCGAAFTLSEGIGYTSTGTTGWAISAAARASTALPHILNSGMLGWALVSAYKEHRYARLIGAFLAAILLHGLWNAISLGLVMNGFSSLVADVPFYLQNAYPWFAGWIILTIGTFIGLIFNNRQMRNASRNQQPAEPASDPA